MSTAAAAPASACTVAVSDLRVGMYVHLDVGWMSHPFPRSSFRISTAEQILTLRELGLERVRCEPARSDFGVFDAAPAPLPPPPSVAPPAPAAPPSDPEALAREARRNALAEQRAALERCERQFAEAGRDCRQALELAQSDPPRARAACEALAQALVDKLLVADQDIAIRLLSVAAGDKASAHALNVSVVSLLLGRVFGLGADEMRDLGIGGLLHDVGKSALAERLRHREDHFTAAEQRGYEDHVAQGVATGRRMGLASGALLIIGQHHEQADGSGFPLRLANDRMAFGARIVALVNRYDNLCNPHVASRALTPHEALSQLFSHGKNRHDPAIMGAFIKMMGVYPAGSTVQLTDDRYALVTSVNSSRPLKPRVLVYEPKLPRSEALLLDLQAEPGLGIRRALKPQALPRPALEYLAPSPRTVYFFEPAPAAQRDDAEPERAAA